MDLVDQFVTKFGLWHLPWVNGEGGKCGGGVKICVFLLLLRALLRECEIIAFLLSERVLRVMGHIKDTHMHS